MDWSRLVWMYQCITVRYTFHFNGEGCSSDSENLIENVRLYVTRGGDLDTLISGHVLYKGKPFCHDRNRAAVYNKQAPPLVKVSLHVGTAHVMAMVLGYSSISRKHSMLPIMLRQHPIKAPPQFLEVLPNFSILHLFICSTMGCSYEFNWLYRRLFNHCPVFTKKEQCLDIESLLYFNRHALFMISYRSLYRPKWSVRWFLKTI